MEIKCVRSIPGYLDVFGSPAHLLQCVRSVKRKFVLACSDENHDFEVLRIQCRQHLRLYVFVVDQDVVGSQFVSFGIGAV